MHETINLSSQIKKVLPAEMVSFICSAGEVAYRQGQSLYLVGGVVRDLLLERPNFDLDLVIEGDAINLAQRLALLYPGKIITHPRFKTAKLQWGKWSVDLATARSETYVRPGALPTVKTGSLESDLFRRDFTINTMAIHLVPNRCGELVDLYGGMYDLEHKLIRVLHEKSFADDATRIWRGLRYEQRLNFHLEQATLKLLRRDIPMLDTISGDRIRHELELILKEEFPEKVLRRASELNVLQKLLSSFRDNSWLKEKFGQARQLSSPNSPMVGLYLALLTYHLLDEETEQLIFKLRLPKSLARMLQDAGNLKAKLRSLTDPELTCSSIYHFLHGFSPLAITANLLTSDSAIAKRHIQLFLDKLRYIRPALTGDDLIRMGIPSGPYIKEILHSLHQARLDGTVKSKRGEEAMVREWLKHKSSSKAV